MPVAVDAWAPDPSIPEQAPSAPKWTEPPSTNRRRLPCSRRV